MLAHGDALKRAQGATDGVGGGGPTRPVSAVQTIRFAAIDAQFEVHAMELGRSAPAADARAAAPRLCVVEADRRRLIGRILRGSELTDAPGAPEPLGVSSLISSHGRLLGGRRRSEPLGRPGAWELV